LVTGGNVPMAAVVSGLLDPSRLTGISRVRQLWLASLGIANAVAVVMILLAGLTVLSYGSVQTRWAGKEIAPRIVIGVAAANLSWWLINAALGLSIGMAVSLAGQGMNPGQVLGGFLVNTAITGGVFTLLLGVVAIVLAVVLALSLIFITVVLTLLIAAAPLALIFHCLPQTEAIAHGWWRIFAATLAVPTVHGLTLALLVRVFYTPGGFSLFGLPTVDELTNLLVLLALLWVMIKTPFWAWAAIKTTTPGGPGGSRSSLLGRVLRAVLVYQTIGMLAGTATAAAGAGAGAATGAGAGGPGGLGGLLGGMARAGGTVGKLGRIGQLLHQRVTRHTTPTSSGAGGAASRVAGLRAQAAAAARSRPRRASGVGPVTFLPPPGSAPHHYRPLPAGPHGTPRPQFLAPTPTQSSASTAPGADSAPAPTSSRPHGPHGVVVPTFQTPAGNPRPRPNPGSDASTPTPRRAPGPAGTSIPTFSSPPAAPSAGAGAGRAPGRSGSRPGPASPEFRGPRPERTAGGAPGYHSVPAPVTFSSPTPRTATDYRPRPAHPVFPHPPAATPPTPTTGLGHPRRRGARTPTTATGRDTAAKTSQPRPRTSPKKARGGTQPGSGEGKDPKR
jgi:hypothetical protein